MEQNEAAAFELARNLMRAKDIHEVMTLQSDYAKAQMSVIQTQAKERGSLVQPFAQVAVKSSHKGQRGARMVGAFFDSNGLISIERVANRFGMSKV